MRECTRCVMNTTDPDIVFDSAGICNHCRQYDKDERQRVLDRTGLPWIIYKMKEAGKGKEYDCLLGLSGGVDSSMCLVKLIEHGIRPLCFSVDNSWNTREADENIMRLVEHYKVPFYRYVLDQERFRELQEAFIMSGTPNIEIPTDHVLMATTYEMSKKYGIRYVISGGNLATESVMPPAWGYSAADLRFIKDVYRRHKRKELSGIPITSMLQYAYHRFIRGVIIVNLLDFYEYNKMHAKQELIEKVGWKDYGEKHAESTFTQWFQNMYLPRMWGYDKRRAHLSSLILSGQMKRSDALIELSKPPAYVDGIKEQFPGLRMEHTKRRTQDDYKNSEKNWKRFRKLFPLLKKMTKLLV